MEKFWRWLYKFCENRIREFYNFEMKCPQCKIWSSIAGVELRSWNDEQERYECMHCHTLTAWHFEGPVSFTVPIKYFGKEQTATDN